MPIIPCPNCGEPMNEGELCWECEHDDGDPFCECDWCLDDDTDLEDEE